MSRAARVGHDGDMTDPQQPTASGPPPRGPDEGFEPRRMRTITDMKRSRDDRVVAGVCAGAAKYLNIDPVIVRVVIAVLTVAGFAGVILYVAAWFLLPSEDADRSIAAEWFKLDRNEEQVRVAGLVGAVVVASLSLVGDSSWAWWGGSPWWLLPLALVVYVVWIRPRRRRDEQARQESAYVQSPAAGTDPAGTRRYDVPAGTAAPTPRETRSHALLGLTLSVAAIAVAATVIYDVTQHDVPWTTYVAVALAVVAVGLLVSTFFGNGGGLIAVGSLLAIGLAVGSLLPNGRLGAQQTTPSVASAVDAHYRHGVGLLEVDLTRVTDPEELLGRTITLDAGIGQTRVIVPDGLAVRVDADLRAGEISLFGREDNGTEVSLETRTAEPAATSLTIDIDQKLGHIEVISR
ncbi:PspC domain-containing protein [Aeromicrobium chenweiae]|nr:PspC domain-containing protein [Aeromicrobium chenweiae]